MRGGVFVMLPLFVSESLFGRIMHRCDMFFSPALTENLRTVAEYMKQQSSEESGS
jgi:hypothetical protein